MLVVLYTLDGKQVGPLKGPVGPEIRDCHGDG